MLDQKTLHAALKKVSAAMMHLENTGFEEKYPIGLIDINLWEWPQGVGPVSYTHLDVYKRQV